MGGSKEMIIKGKSVVLRAIELEDADMLRQMMNDSEIETMMWGSSYPVSKHNQIAWINSLGNNNSTFRAIIDVNDSGIGTIILSDIDMKNGNAEIHIKLADANMRGRGYGTDAVRTLTKYAFNELRLNCVYCRVHADNVASQKMFLKCGFKQEGVLRSRVFKNGVFHDFNQYSILKSDVEVLRCEK